MKTFLFLLTQYCLPQHILSRLVGKLAAWQAPRWLKHRLIRWFINKNDIDLSIAEKTSIDDYPTFNAFFIRRVQPALRPIDAEDVIVSPADGVISQMGHIDGTTLLQAKNIHYSLTSLLANDAELINAFNNGAFATIYLSPRDYHRVHMPFCGKLIRSIYVKGKLFSVNATMVSKLPNLFTRNERLINVFATEIGTMAVIMIGAMLVAGIHTVWQGKVTPNRLAPICDWRYHEQNIVLQKGIELGYFNFGSTVITLLPPQTATWLDSLQPGKTIKFGQALSLLFTANKNRNATIITDS